MKKQLTALLLVFGLLFVLLAGCNGGESATSKEPKDVSQGEDNSFPLEAKNFDTTIKILCVETARHLYGEQQFVYNPENDGNVVNDTIKNRNDFIYENYGITIETVPVKYPSETIALSIAGGSDEYHIVSESIDRMLPYATQNYYWSLDRDLLLDKPWWDQNAITNLSITDKTFFVAGDGIITDDDHTYLVLYNKNMYDDYGELKGKHGDIYDIVKEGEWTYDLMYEMGKTVSAPDNDGNWTTTGGTYGLLASNYGSGIIVGGSGVPSAEKAGDGDIKLLVDTERSINAFNKMFDMMNDKTYTLRVEQVNNSWSDIFDMFVGGQGLFYLTTTQGISNIKLSTEEKKADFGILPIPKFAKEQTSYFNGINIYHSTVLGVPTTNMSDYDATVYLLEALGYYSRFTPGSVSVIDAYYEITLKLQAMDATEDEEMLDLIFANRMYDIGAIFNWGGRLLDVYSYVMRSGNNNFVSHFESIKSGAEEAMKDTIKAYQSLIT